MQLSEKGRERLADELRYITKQMREKQDIVTQLYLFSAGYGLIGRLLNENWDAELSLIYLILQGTHSTINNRLQSLTSGRDQAVTIPETLMPALINTTEKLEDAIRNKRDNEIYPILARFGELCYVTTGNGYYLFLKGDIKI